MRNLGSIAVIALATQVGCRVDENPACPTKNSIIPSQMWSREGFGPAFWGMTNNDVLRVLPEMFETAHGTLDGPVFLGGSVGNGRLLFVRHRLFLIQMSFPRTTSSFDDLVVKCAAIQDAIKRDFGAPKYAVAKNKGSLALLFALGYTSCAMWESNETIVHEECGGPDPESAITVRYEGRHPVHCDLQE